MSNFYYFALILLLFISAAPFKLLAIFLKKSHFESPLVKKIIRYIPVALFSSLLCSEIFFQGNQNNFSLNHSYVYAAIPTFLVAFFTKSLSFSIITGVLSVSLFNLWLL